MSAIRLHLTDLRRRRDRDHPAQHGDARETMSAASSALPGRTPDGAMSGSAASSAPPTPPPGSSHGRPPLQPQHGPFLQTDPVLGGSDNAYDYAGHDPLNAFDLDGRMIGDEGGQNLCGIRGKYWGASGCRTGMGKRGPRCLIRNRRGGCLSGRVYRAYKEAAYNIWVGTGRPLFMHLGVRVEAREALRRLPADASPGTLARTLRC